MRRVADATICLKNALIFDQKCMTAVPPPPTLFTRPSLCDFFLFLQMKRDMKGKRFAKVAAVKKKTTGALSGITTDELKKIFRTIE